VNNDNAMYDLASKLFSINRSLTGDGVRETLHILKEILRDLKIFEVKSNTNVFDWTVPKEWYIKEAWIKTPSGRKICDFSVNNLYLVGYSTPVRMKLNKEELELHLHSLPDQPDAIPYITSYYKEYWGFCISHNERITLEDGT
jgi:aminopeptidase-like protein